MSLSRQLCKILPSFRKFLIEEGHVSRFSDGTEMGRWGLEEDGGARRRPRNKSAFAADDFAGLIWNPEMRQNSAKTRRASSPSTSRVIAEKSPK